MRLSLKPAHSIIVLACMTVGVVLFAVALLLQDLRVRELERSRLETQGLTQLFMRQTEHSFESADMVLQGVQERLQTPMGRQFSLDSEQIHLLLNTRAHLLNATGSLLLVDQNGQVVNSSVRGPELGANLSTQQIFKVFLNKEDPGLYIDRPSKTQQQGLWTLNLARKLVDAKNQFRGVVVVTLQIASLEQLFSHVKLEYDRPISIYMADGSLVASSPHRETLMGAVAPELNLEVLPKASGELRLIKHQSGDGGGIVFYLGRLKAFPFLVSVTNDEDMALASWRETSVPIALGAALMLIAIVSVAGFLMRELRREENMNLALNEAHVRYLHTVESVMDAIVAIDENQCIQLFNPAAENMFQMKSSQVLGKNLSVLLPTTMRHVHVMHVEKFSNSQGSSRAMAPSLDILGRRADGSEFPIESTISKTLIGGKVQMTAVLRDVTQRRKAEAELRNMNEQLRELSASLQEVREQERTRISRELHDDLGQQLTGLKLELAWLSTRIKEGREMPIERVTEMKQMLDVAIASVRRISTDLRPLILDDLGFAEAVEWHATEVAKRSNLKIELELSAHECVKDDVLATALFRIVQEALNNVLRHSAAKHVLISLTREAEFLCLRIQDDGKGMPEKIRKGGIGLVSMRERVTSLGGEFKLIDGLKEGAKSGLMIEVKLPLARHEVEGAS
jgi:PAS domain S-box-containing protein